jgi:hypothetical protein
MSRPSLAIFLLSIGIAAVLVGCGGSDKAPSPLNPLKSLQDPSSSVFVDKNLHAVLNKQGVGPAAFTFAKPTSPDVQFWVNCTPDSKFTVTMGSFFKAGCERVNGASGGIPVKAELSPDGRLTAKLEIPHGVHYWIVGIPFDPDNPDQ